MRDVCDLLCLDLPRAEELRANGLTLQEADVMAARLQALADPTRRELLDELFRRDGQSLNALAGSVW